MSSQVSLSAIAQELETLTDEERAALRASRFHSAPQPSPDRRCRLAHPGGAIATNKAAALAKFLKRKLEKDGAASLDPDLVERAVENAKAAGRPGIPAMASANVRHVDSFSDSHEDEDFNSQKTRKIGGTLKSWTTTKSKKRSKNGHKFPHANKIDLKVKTRKNRKTKKHD